MVNTLKCVFCSWTCINGDTQSQHFTIVTKFTSSSSPSLITISFKIVHHFHTISVLIHPRIIPHQISLYLSPKLSPRLSPLLLLKKWTFSIPFSLVKSPESIDREELGESLKGSYDRFTNSWEKVTSYCVQGINRKLRHFFLTKNSIIFIFIHR